VSTFRNRSIVVMYRIVALCIVTTHASSHAAWTNTSTAEAISAVLICPFTLIAHQYTKNGNAKGAACAKACSDGLRLLNKLFFFGNRAGSARQDYTNNNTIALRDCACMAGLVAYDIANLRANITEYKKAVDAPTQTTDEPPSPAATDNNLTPEQAQAIAHEQKIAMLRQAFVMYILPIAETCVTVATALCNAAHDDDDDDDEDGNSRVYLAVSAQAYVRLWQGYLAPDRKTSSKATYEVLLFFNTLWLLGEVCKAFPHLIEKKIDPNDGQGLPQDHPPINVSIQHPNPAIPGTLSRQNSHIHITIPPSPSARTLANSQRPSSINLHINTGSTATSANVSPLQTPRRIIASPVPYTPAPGTLSAESSPPKSVARAVSTPETPGTRSLQGSPVTHPRILRPRATSIPTSPPMFTNALPNAVENTTPPPTKSPEMKTGQMNSAPGESPLTPLRTIIIDPSVLPSALPAPTTAYSTKRPAFIRPLHHRQLSNIGEKGESPSPRDFHRFLGDQPLLLDNENPNNENMPLSPIGEIVTPSPSVSAEDDQKSPENNEEKKVISPDDVIGLTIHEDLGSPKPNTAQED